MWRGTLNTSTTKPGSITQESVSLKNQYHSRHKQTAAQDVETAAIITMSWNPVAFVSAARTDMLLWAVLGSRWPGVVYMLIRGVHRPLVRAVGDGIPVRLLITLANCQTHPAPSCCSTTSVSSWHHKEVPQRNIGLSHCPTLVLEEQNSEN